MRSPSLFSISTLSLRFISVVAWSGVQAGLGGWLGSDRLGWGGWEWVGGWVGGWIGVM